MTRRTAREEVDLSTPERAWQDVVRDYARWTGWRTYHTYDSRRSDPGFPDLTMIRRGRLVFAELKREKASRVTFDQGLWIADLREVPGGVVEVYLWRPSDWPTVEKVLR